MGVDTPPCAIASIIVFLTCVDGQFGIKMLCEGMGCALTYLFFFSGIGLNGHAIVNVVFLTNHDGNSVAAEVDQLMCDR